MPLNPRSKRYAARGGAKKKGRNRLLSSRLPKKTKEPAISDDRRSRAALDDGDGDEDEENGSECAERMVARVLRAEKSPDLALDQDELILLWTTCMGGLGRKGATANRRRDFGHWVLVS